MLNFSIPNISPERFIFDHDGQYHVLKHFSVIDDKYLQVLVDKGSYSRRDVLKRMEKFGSKFHEDFLSNPVSVIQLLENEGGFVLNERSRSESRIELQLIFDKVRYPEGIGSDTLLRKEDFIDGDKMNIRMRKGFPIHYATGAPKSTWEMYFIFTRSYLVAGASEDKWRLATFFPGKYAPPFPDKSKQSDSEFEQNVSFWKEHLFLTE